MISIGNNNYWITLYNGNVIKIYKIYMDTIDICKLNTRIYRYNNNGIYSIMSRINFKPSNI